jgi:hypothetical protein
LHRQPQSRYGNDPAHWQASAPTPGTADGEAGKTWRLSVTLELGGTAVRVRALGSGADIVVLQRSTDLRQWTNIDTNQAVSGVVEFLEAIPTGAGTRYYRALILQ